MRSPLDLDAAQVLEERGQFLAGEQVGKASFMFQHLAAQDAELVAAGSSEKEAQLPSGYGYVSITVPDPSVSNRGQVRLLVGLATGKAPVFFATVNHYRSFYALFTEDGAGGK